MAFLVHGAVIANWVPRVPAVKAALGTSDGPLGLAMLGLGVGAAASLLVAGRVVARFGSRPVVRVAGVAVCASLAGPGLAGDLPLLAVTLGLVGATSGLLDVAMNAHGALVERGYGRSIMASLHGLWSVGGLLGAVTGGLAARAGWSPARHFAVAALCLGATVVVGTRRLLPAAADAAPTGPVPAAPGAPVQGPGGPREDGGTPGRGSGVPWSAPLLVLGVVGFSSFFGEGSAHDWSAIYLHDVLDTSAGMAAAGFGAFSLAMAAVRFAGDRLSARFGPVRLVRASGLVAATGFGLGLLAHQPLAGVAGFALLGAGLACVVPVTFSAAGHLGGGLAGVAISRVAAISYLATFVGPPVIGLVADLTSLTVALAIPVALAGVVALCARAVATAA
ncbi:MAG TPA: MFS transporter [Actinomycetes bacterium]|nr:MFS transporter [Actinomycetes bacterium]